MAITVSNCFQIKSANMAMVSLILESTHTDEVIEAMRDALSQKAAFFDNDAAILDLSFIEDSCDDCLDFQRICDEALKFGLRVVAVKGGSPEQYERAQACGLADGSAASVGLSALKARAAAKPALEEGAEVAPWQSPLVVEGPVRAGQTVYAQGRDLVVLSGVNAGAEVISDGSVHVYGPLRGRALAGAKGSPKAFIYANSLESELVALAGIFETAEGANLMALRGRPVLVSVEFAEQVNKDGQRDGRLLFKDLVNSVVPR